MTCHLFLIMSKDENEVSQRYGGVFADSKICGVRETAIASKWF
jgi:hypothetical protein